MINTRFIIIVTIIYLISMILIIAFANHNLIEYLITLTSTLYLLLIVLKILSEQNNTKEKIIMIKEPKSKIEYLQSLTEQLIKGKNKQAALLILTEEIREIGSQILATYFKTNVLEIKSMPSEILSKVVSDFTTKIIKGDEKLHNEQELINVINDLKNLLKNI